MDIARFERLVRTHQAEIYRYVRYLGAERDSAEDLVQDTFLAAHANPGPLEGDEDVGVPASAAWLRGIARNKFLMHCRRSKRDPVALDAEALERREAVWREAFVRDGDGFDYLEALRRCIEGLPPKQRQAVDLQYAQAKSRSEIAQLLRMTADGIKSLMRRIRDALGGCIEKRVKSTGGGAA
jgi:RNA polymerase sigma-70 factor (ECF subfamily)